MQIRKKIQKSNKRYIIDVNGKISRTRWYTKTILSMIFNQNLLLRREIFKILRKLKGKKKVKYNYRNIYWLLKKLKSINWQIRQRRLFIKRLNLYKFKKTYYRKFSLYRKFRLYYSNLKINYLKNLYLKFKNKKKRINLFFEILERRLDCILVRSVFFHTMFAARHFIKYRHIYINNKKNVKKTKFLINIGDCVGIKTNYLKINIYEYLRKLIKKRRFISINPAYLETDYRLLLTTLVYKPRCKEIKYYFTLKDFLKYFYFMWNHFSRRK